MDIFAQLTQDALRLKELDELSVKFVRDEWNLEELIKTLCEFAELKKKIKTALIECPIVEIHNNTAREVLREISQEEIFNAEKILKCLENQAGESFEFDKLEIEAFSDLGMYLFYSWFSDVVYLEGLYEIGSLIVGYSVPDSLKSYVSEAKRCYAFQQYNAVYGLCRTIIEVALRDKCERDEKIIDLFSYSLRELVNKCTNGSLRYSLHKILDNTNKLIHGRKTVKQEDAKQMFKDTLRAVQELYGN